MKDVHQQKDERSRQEFQVWTDANVNIRQKKQIAKEDDGSEGRPGDETAQEVRVVWGGSKAPSILPC